MVYTITHYNIFTNNNYFIMKQKYNQEHKIIIYFWKSFFWNAFYTNDSIWIIED